MKLKSTATPETRRETRLHAAVAASLAFLSLLLYLRTLCPTAYMGDSGEISTAIATGGIIHPPGYPLFALLGRIALRLIPFGEPAFRIGCVVALAAALATGVVYLLGRALDLSRWASGTAAAFFGGSFTFWNQSTRVEVYSTHVLLSGLMLLLALHYRKTGRLPLLLAAAVCGGLGIAHHLTIVLLGPAVLLLVLPRLWHEPHRWRGLAGAAALLCAGPLLYGLLILWARAEPVYNWGHPVDLPSLWNHASAKLYQGLLKFPDRAHLSRRLPEMWGLWTDNFPFLLFLAPLAGGVLLWRRDRLLAAGLALGAAVICCYNLFYRISDIAPYFLNVWVIGALLLAVTLDAAWRALERFPHRAPAAGVAAALLVTAVLLRNWSACDLHSATWMREFARHKLESADPNAVLIMQTDEDAFPIMYVHDVLRVRPDVLPVDRLAVRGTWQVMDKEPSEWYLRHLQTCGVKLELERPRDPETLKFYADDGYLVKLIRGPLAGRPLNITWFDDPSKYSGRPFMRWARTRYDQLPVGLVIRLQPKGQRVDPHALLAENERIWRRISLPRLGHVRADQDMDSFYLPEHYSAMLLNFGGLYELNGDRQRAATVYDQVARWNPEFKPAQQALQAVRATGERRL